MDLKIIDTTMMAIIAVVIISAAAIPITLQMINDADGDIHPGDTWTYTVTTNLDDTETVTISVGGDGAKYCTITDRTIVGEFPDEGNYTIEITAMTTHPTQYAVKVINLKVFDASQYTVLLYIIPTILIVALIIGILQGAGIIDLSAEGRAEMRRKDGPSDDWSDSDWGSR